MKEDSRLMVISNAGPFKHIKDEVENEIVAQEVAGGLSSAYKNLLTKSEEKESGIWISYGRGEYDYSDQVLDENNKVEVPEDAPPDQRYEVKRVEMPNQIYGEYYYGFSNKTLWPWAHNKDPEFEEDSWSSYLEANKRFAQSIAEEYKPGDTILVQDYHLLPLPNMVREELEDKYSQKEAEQAEIGFRLHIYYPPLERFKELKEKGQQLLEGVSAADQITFHRERYKENFFDSVEYFNEGEVIDSEQGLFELNGNLSFATAIPLGIDTDFWNPTDEFYIEPDLVPEQERENLEQIQEEVKGPENYNTDILGVMVDRLDYTKDVDQRMKKIYDFFESDKGEKLKGELSFIGCFPKSRSDLERYSKLQKEVNRWIGKINKEIGGDVPGWTPIYSNNGIDQESEQAIDLKDIYHAADFSLLTPGLDGENLTLKEYVGTNPLPKVEVSSIFPGAYQDLKDGVIGVNHKNNFGKSLGDAIFEAVKLSQAEEGELYEKKTEMWKEARRVVKEKNIEWSRDEELNQLHEHSNRLKK